MTPQQALRHEMAWQRSGDAEFPYQARHEGMLWRVRVNDFPAQALYTLLVDGAEWVDFDDWPRCWHRP